MRLSSFLKLINWKHLLFLCVSLHIIKYGFIETFKDSHQIVTTLNYVSFLIFTISALCIAAAGYIINTIYNKPYILKSEGLDIEKSAFNSFIILNILGVFLGFLLSYYIDASNYFVAFFVCSALLYLNASALRQIVFVGNIINALVASFAILGLALFDLLPSVNSLTYGFQITFLNIILDFSILSFFLILIYTLIRDIITVNNDYNSNIQTLPIILGRERASKITGTLSIILSFIIIYYLITYLFKQEFLVGYYLVTLVAPLLYSGIVLFSELNTKKLKYVDFAISASIIFSVLSLIIYSFVL